MSNESLSLSPFTLSFTENPAFSYKASNETGPNSVPNPTAPYNPPDISTSEANSLASLAKLYPALPNTYKASFPDCVVTRLNFPNAYTGALLNNLSLNLSFNFPEFEDNLYSAPTPHSNSPWLSKIYSAPKVGPFFNLRFSPSPNFASLLKSYPNFNCPSDAIAFNANKAVPKITNFFI